MEKFDHNKIISETARQKLKPYGILQKGKSRLWIDDQGWYLILIEFQPFANQKGTTLNVGINFNWFDKNYFSFDIGYRQDVEFMDFKDENQFSERVNEFCEIALSKVLYYREKLNGNKLNDFIINQMFTSDDLWGNYHKGTYLGIMGKTEEMKKYYSRLLLQEPEFEWIKELQSRTKFLFDSQDFNHVIKEIILNTRNSKKLKVKEINLPN